MELKKGICTNCHTNNINNRIFLVNPKADVCYCPNCLSEIDPKVAIANYNAYIDKEMNKAKKLMHQDTRFHDAYLEFAKIIELDNNVEAYLNRILCLVYMSTLRDATFMEAMALIKEEASIFNKAKNIKIYIDYLLKINHAVDEYFSRFGKHLTYHNAFFDMDCLILYATRLKEMLTLSSYILEEVNKNNNKNAKYEANKVENTINKIKDKQKETFELVNGEKYIIKEYKNTSPIFDSQDNNKKIFQGKLLPYKLVKTGHGQKIINDKVYPDNTRLALYLSYTIMCATLCGIIALISGGLTLYFKNTNILAILFSIMGISVALVITIIILHVYWTKKLAKRRHLID